MNADHYDSLTFACTCREVRRELLGIPACTGKPPGKHEFRVDWSRHNSHRYRELQWELGTDLPIVDSYKGVENPTLICGVLLSSRTSSHLKVWFFWSSYHTPHWEIFPRSTPVGLYKYVAYESSFKTPTPPLENPTLRPIFYPQSTFTRHVSPPE